MVAACGFRDAAQGSEMIGSKLRWRDSLYGGRRRQGNQFPLSRITTEEIARSHWVAFHRPFSEGRIYRAPDCRDSSRVGICIDLQCAEKGAHALLYLRLGGTFLYAATGDSSISRPTNFQKFPIFPNYVYSARCVCYIARPLLSWSDRAVARDAYCLRQQGTSRMRYPNFIRIEIIWRTVKFFGRVRRPRPSVAPCRSTRF